MVRSMEAVTPGVWWKYFCDKCGQITEVVNIEGTSSTCKLGGLHVLLREKGCSMKYAHCHIYIVGSYRETILIITLALLAFVPSNPRWSYFRTQNAQMVRWEPNLSSPPLMDTNSLPVVRELSLDLDITRFVWFLWRYLRYRWGAYEILGVLRFVIRIFYGQIL